MLPDALEQDSDEYVFHPALLDACLQAVIPADSDFDQRNGGLYLPHEIEAVRLFRRPGHRVWVHARLLEKTPHRSVSDVDIYNEDGRLAARVRGLRSHRVAGGREESLDDLLYAYQWRPQPRSEADSRAGTRQAGSSSRTTAASARGSRSSSGLVAMLCTVVHVGSTFRGLRPGTLPDQSRPAGRHAAAHRGRRRARSIALPRHRPPVESRRTASGRAERGRSPGCPGAGTAERRVARPSLGPRRPRPVRAAIPGDPRRPVGRGPTRAGGDRPGPRGRAGAGHRRRIPRLRCKLVDLDPGADDGGVGSLFEEIQSADDEDEVACARPRAVRPPLPAGPGSAVGGSCEARPRPAFPTAWRRGGPGRSMAWSSRRYGGGRRGRARSRSRSSPPASTSVT